MNESIPVYEVDLTTMAYGGNALGRLPDGRAVFVPFGIAGERVRLRVVEEKRNHVVGELIEILRPAAERIQPLCAHFGVCGGCHYQQIAYPAQLAIKRDILRDQLERIGGIPTPPVRETVASPSEYYYRNTVQFHLSPEGRLGYQRLDGKGVLPISECHLPEAPINELWPQLDPEPIPGLERVAIREGAGEDLLLSFESSDPEAPEFSVDIPISAVFLSPAGSIVLAGNDYTVMEVLGRAFRVSAESFFQVNTPMAGAMVEHILARLPFTPGATVLDLYCGVGLFSAFLAPRAGRVIGVEVSASACDDFAANLDEFENVDLYQGEAEEILPHLQVKPEAVVVDPPRAGLERRALDAIVAMRPQVLAYISCDPSTLARDAKRLLTAGYHLVESTPFDLFPQTFHIESISIFQFNQG